MTDPPIGEDHHRVVETYDFEFYRHLFAYETIAARLPAGARVLEVGCGAGYGAAHLAASGADVVATDFSAEAVEYARHRYPAVRFEQASATALRFPDASFDAVVSCQVIEHIDDDVAYARALARVLRRGGAVYVTTPNRRTRLLPFQRPWNAYHVREYDARGLHAVLTRAFDDVTIHGIATTPPLMAKELRRTRRNMLKALVPARAKAVLARRRRSRVTPATPVPSLGAGLDAFHVTGDTRRCLDLFAISRAPRPAR